MNTNKKYLALLFPFMMFGAMMQNVSQKSSVPEILNYSEDDSEIISTSKRMGGLAVLEAYKNTVLSAQVRSPVTKIHSKMGDHFNEGDVLIELDNSEYSIQFMKARAMYKKNEALYNSKKKLYDQNIVSYSEIIEAEANKEAAKADLDQAQLNLGNTVLLAPYTGKVKKIFIQEGELAKYGSELIEIISDHKLVANILLPFNYKKSVNRGDKFLITFDDSPEPVEAVVERVSHIIDPASATIKIEAYIENAERKLHAGMSGWAKPIKQKE